MGDIGLSNNIYDDVVKTQFSAFNVIESRTEY